MEKKRYMVIVKEMAFAEVIVEAEDVIDAKCKALEIAQTQDLEWESDEGVYVGTVYEIGECS